MDMGNTTHQTPKEAVMKSHTTTIVEAPASEEGALDGFKIVCDDCGPVACYSILSMSQSEARKHTDLMIKWGK